MKHDTKLLDIIENHAIRIKLLEKAVLRLTKRGKGQLIHITTECKKHNYVYVCNCDGCPICKMDKQMTVSGEQ